MKSHMLLLHTVIHELGDRCGTSTSRDWKTITARVEHEGLSYLTITLPQFCSDFQKSLEEGKVAPSFFAGYAKKGYLPRFLSGFTERVFNTSNGCLVDEPDIEAIYAVRQITLLFGKIELPCSDARVSAAMDKYINCEYAVKLHDEQLEYSDLEDFKRMSWLVWGSVFSKVDKSIHDGDLVPKHGPGATADRLRGNAKYNQNRWTRRLEEVFPHGEYLFPSWSHFLDSPDIDCVEPGEELPVRVITVPKTLKTPRIIAIEPTCMQYTQQGILECLTSFIRADRLVSNFIDFNAQEPNQLMAKQGSKDGSLATLDLSEASDRVSNQLVRNMCGPWYWLSSALDATRTRKADVPGYGIIRLAKFASMGSALCFPIEVIVFLTIIFLGIQKELRRPLTKRDLYDLVGKVRVFGDDIIVPKEYVHSVITELQTFGFVVNSDKSFWTGKFRESCGKEYYDDVDVSIVRVRAMLPTKRTHASEIVSAVSLRNQMYHAGLWRSAAMLDDHLGALIPLPNVLPTSPGLGRHSFLGYSEERYCPNLQKPLVKAAVLHSPLPPSHLEGYGALLKVFLKRGSDPFQDENHLERAGRPIASNIRIRWVSPT